MLSDKDPEHLFHRANISLCAIFNWFRANKLSLNAAKTQYMVIQPHNRKQNISAYNLKIDDVVLTKANSCKFLGIIIDESLSWKPQISSINSKISRAIFAIKQVKFTLPLDSLRTLYYALIHPHLIYGLLAWGNANLNLLHKTDILQKRALRTIHNKKYNSHTEPLYKHSGILKISHLYQLEVMLFMHDYTRDNLPTSFQNVFRVNREVHGIYETRQAHLFYIPWTKSRFVDKLPLFHFPKIWNSWCAQLDVSTTRNGLKRSVKTLFLQNYSVVVTCFNPRCCECNKTA